jgi:hypothetical protein
MSFVAGNYFFHVSYLEELFIKNECNHLKAAAGD